MKKALSLLTLASLPLSACAMQEGDFPSLAKRPYEDINPGREPSPQPQSIAALPAPINAALNEAVAKSGAAHAKFLRNLPSVKRRVSSARGSTVSSEVWVIAQMDLAALEMNRSPSVSALADIDALYIVQLSAEYDSNETGGAEAISKQRDKTLAQVKLQQDEINSLKDALR